MALSKREIFLDYVRHGGEKFFSPQIGAGAGFDAKLAGKEWISETTLEDTLAAGERKHIVAASDYLFYGIPEENVRVMAEAVEEWRGKKAI